MKNVVYLISDVSDEFELPAFVTDSRKEAASFLGISAKAFSSMLSRKQRIRKRYRAERVIL